MTPNESALRTWFADIFAVVIFISCMTFFFWASFFLPKDKKDLTHIAEIKTAMISICTWVVAYYYGSYQGAARKDAIIKDMTEANKKLTDEATVTKEIRSLNQ